MKSMIFVCLVALVAVAVADDYYKPSYKPSYKPQYHHQPSYKPQYEEHHYAPTEYKYDAPAYDYYGGNANLYLKREPYSVNYDLKEYGAHGSHQNVGFQQTFGSYKGYH